MSGSDPPTHLYLLEMDSSLNLTNNETQVFPLHLLNSSSDYGQNRFFLPVQTKDGEASDQIEVLIDTSPNPAVKFVTLQVDKSCEEVQKQLSYHSEPLLSSTLQSVNSEQKLETCETQLISPSLINISEQTHESHDTVQKKHIQNYVHISDRSVPPRAIAVLPSILQIRQKDVISPRRTLLPRTRFGPIQGVKQKMTHEEVNELMLTSVTITTPIFIMKDEDQLIHINVSDKDKSNWIGLLPLGDDSTANVWIYEENHELYAITTESVPSRKQLMLGYSKKYAQDYGLIGPTRDLEIGSPPNRKSWWCYECQRAMASASQLQRHMDAHRQEELPLARRRRYRCRHCSRTFSRIFTLRRHVARYCEKKPFKRDNNINTDILPESILNSTLNSEDNRVPSDESFQNYSNGLDFSTNLFDTDRMPSLDISGNSRSEVFNPYGLVSESPLSSELGYTNGSSNKLDTPINDHNEKTQQEEKTESSPIPCPYCNQNVAKGKKRQHVSECPARRFECECKKIFPSKELFALHIYTEHPKSKEAEDHEQNGDNNIDSVVAIQDNKTYLCEQCQHSFKRRGMLVNHLWRVHNTVSARVPLERRVRHYPCGACPKMYRTAAKRDRHVTVHHPGSENIRAKEIEAGTRSCSPAACPVCPRQYATRAKLLQHQRQHHPHTVPIPPKKTNITQRSVKNDRLHASEEILKDKATFQQLLHFY